MGTRCHIEGESFGKPCGRSLRVNSLCQSVIKLEHGWEGSAKELVDISYHNMDICQFLGDNIKIQDTHKSHKYLDSSDSFK